MAIFSVSLGDNLLRRFDKALGQKGYIGRSQALREMIQSYVTEEEWTYGSSGKSIAVVSILYEKKAPKEQVSEIEHKHERLIQTTLHSHLDNENCLEVFIAKGNGKEIEGLVKEIKKVKGVKQVKCINALSGS